MYSFDMFWCHLQFCDYALVQPLWLRQSWIYHDLILSTLQLLGYPLGQSFLVWSHPTMESPATNRQKQAETKTTHALPRFLIPNASLSNPRDILPCGCIGVVVTIHSFLAMPAMLPLILAVAAVKCLAESPNWRKQFAQLLGILNLAKTFLNMHFEQFPNPKLHHGLLWHQLFQKRIFEHFNNTIFGKKWQLISMRQTWMVSKLFCEDINHLYVYSTCVAPSSRVFLLDFRRLKSQLDLAPGLCVKVLIIVHVGGGIVHVGGGIVVEGDVTMVTMVLAPLWRIFAYRRFICVTCLTTVVWAFFVFKAWF